MGSFLLQYQRIGFSERRYQTVCGTKSSNNTELSSEMLMFDDLELRVAHHWFLPSVSGKSYHPNWNSIEFLKSGQMEFLEDGEVIELHAPVIFWMKKGHAYSFRMCPGSPPCEHIFCDCTGAVSDRMIQYLDDKCPGKVLKAADFSRFSDVFFEMLRYYRMDKVQWYPEILGGYVRLMLLLENELKQKEFPGKDPYNIRHISAEICRDPFQRFDFHRIAAELGISYEHFRRLFRMEHHSTPPEFLRMQRISAAAAMLRDTNLRIKEIADTCQYSSLVEFSRSFKRYFGVSPQEYRNRD